MISRSKLKIVPKLCQSRPSTDRSYLLAIILVRMRNTIFLHHLKQSFYLKSRLILRNAKLLFSYCRSIVFGNVRVFLIQKRIGSRWRRNLATYLLRKILDESVFHSKNGLSFSSRNESVSGKVSCYPFFVSFEWNYF